ncbi:MAG: hypothetical protein AB7V42_14140 [Thermoleophilia bacterium]
MNARARLAAVVALVLATLVAVGSAVAGTTRYSAGVQRGPGPVDITAGPDGALWYTGGLDDSVIRMGTGGDGLRRFTDGITPGAGTSGIAVGPDGNLWFTEYLGDRIGRITPDGVVTEFSEGLTPLAGPYDIAAGADGSLWFTEIDADRIGRIAPDGEIVEFSAGISAGALPSDIALGADGNLWFTEYGGDRIGRITPDGVVTEFSEGITPGSAPSGITRGPDGAMWFTEELGDAVGRITATGAVSEFPLGPVGLGPSGITTGPDGNLWFGQLATGTLGSITPQGVVDLEPYGVEPVDAPTNITTGSDGNLWFTDSRGTAIGRHIIEPRPAEAPVHRPPPSSRPPGLPSLQILPPSGIGRTSVTLNALVGALGKFNVVEIDYGPTPSYGRRVVRHGSRPRVGRADAGLPDPRPSHAGNDLPLPAHHQGRHGAGVGARDVHDPTGPEREARGRVPRSDPECTRGAPRAHLGAGGVLRHPPRGGREGDPWPQGRRALPAGHALVAAGPRGALRPPRPGRQDDLPAGPGRARVGRAAGSRADSGCVPHQRQGPRAGEQDPPRPRRPDGRRGPPLSAGVR